MSTNPELWLDRIVPHVTREGEKALAELNTPARAYDLMKACDGRVSFWSAIQKIDYPIKTAVDAAAYCLALGWIEFRLSHATGISRFKMGDFLVEMGLVHSAQLAEALHHQPAKGKRLGELLQEMGVLTEIQLKFALRMQTLFRLAVH